MYLGLAAALAAWYNGHKRKDFPDERGIVDAHKTVYPRAIKGFAGGG